ncbi:DNA-directed RNA polymerase sigma subunit (sigma70/sigma32) [Arthrobacter sp. V4I6]|uniref:sigma factor-like helix-turn-helix DNA-binding protein n=1 Tax=unclassified Arthrobacter TaxID=235627 RepID=UPI002783C4AE|nr:MULTISPECIES: sigma factor-like helix-turn-helix DNA-binding protein [unclassified Arthrobacter]MDQ0822420.1 DNA-directed RNA polymerase sigma subunit (sigma70/sigma32) [Arthrobacter sp. V1I7]MDQ0852046.1 DNA-directed RNA polymerase sigma subunit (sigma70/sigma32) [Arthrobacter sp. V4I6]
MPDGNGGTAALAEQLLDPADLDAADPLFLQQLKERVHAVIDTLDEQEAAVIAMRFGMTGEEKTLEAVGKAYGMTREHIRQIEVTAMTKLKHPSRSDRLRQYRFDGANSSGEDGWLPNNAACVLRD